MRRTQPSLDQLGLNFEPGLTQKYRTLTECVAAVVHASKAGLTGCAIACDVSPSTLSKMLNKQDDAENKRNFPADLLVPIVLETNDYRPLHWLAEKLTPASENARIDDAIHVVSQIAPLLPALIEAVGTLKKAKSSQRSAGS